MTDDSRQQFLEVKFRVDREHLDAVSNFVIENIANGILLDDEEDVADVGLTFYVPPPRQAQYREALERYLSAVLTTVPRLSIRSVTDMEWIDRYKQSVQPLVLANDVVIRPSWHEAPLETPYDIIIEPKMAFGTGTHETTRSCLTLIREHFKTGMSFLDLGCGSGILSILAAKMGALRLMAIDYDVMAIDNCRENFDLNTITAPYDIRFGSIDKTERNSTYDFVVANIIRRTIEDWLPRLQELTRPNGILLLSGLLRDDEAVITDRLTKLGETVSEVIHDGDWVTLLVRRDG